MDSIVSYLANLYRYRRELAHQLLGAPAGGLLGKNGADDFKRACAFCSRSPLQVLVKEVGEGQAPRSSSGK